MLPHAVLAACFCSLLVSANAAEDVCAAFGAADASGAAAKEHQSSSLLQQRFQTTGNTALLTEDACCGGVFSNDRCWHLGEAGQNCDAVCSSRSLVYSFAAPLEDMAPRLLGRSPSGGRQSPWLFLECFVPTEDRYHPFNPNAWGVPEKTPAAELAQAGQYSYDTCRLACPCAAATGLPAPAPVPGFPAPVPGLPAPGPVPGAGAAPPSPVISCTGIEKNARCWYLSAVGDNCDNTCALNGPSCSFRFGAPGPGDVMPQLLGHVPNGKQNPWLFAECYVPDEDRYHPYNANAWGVPEKTPVNELAQAGQYSYATCRLSCSCQGVCTGVPATGAHTAPGLVARNPGGAPYLPLSPLTASPLASSPAANLAATQCEGGRIANGRCWYLSELGDSCDSTCARRGCGYSFAAPPQGDMVPELIGHVPQTRQDPWLCLECYAPKEDRYHPYNPRAWGVPGMTAASEMQQAGQIKHDECRLSCPCEGTCTGGTIPLAVPSSMPPLIPNAVPTLPSAASLDALRCNDGIGVNVMSRCWYLSNTGDSCDSTCAAHGMRFLFAGLVEDMVPTLVGHLPTRRQEPWTFVECYVPGEDRYHPFNRDTPPAELAAAGQWTYSTCQLACPCAAAVGAAPAPLPPVLVPAPPLGGYAPAPAFGGSATSVTCSGLASYDRCWYLSDVGQSCDQTCASHGPGCQYAFAAPLEDLTPVLIGHVPAGRQDPWLFAECYVPQEDRYHPVNANAWGVPGKTPPSEMAQAGQYSHDSCMLSCPCLGTCIAATTAGSVLRVLGRPAPA